VDGEGEGEALDADASTSTITSCPICNKHEARYTCPRCYTPYCSASCYATHDIKCTEEFYKKKVSEVSNLAIQEEGNVRRMRNILTRTTATTNNDSSIAIGGGGGGGSGSGYDGENEAKVNEECDDNGNENEYGGSHLTDEELVELATHVLNLNDDNDEDEDEDDDDQNSSSRSGMTTAAAALPQHLALKFEEAVRRGELTHLLENIEQQKPQPFTTPATQFHPYWLPQHEHGHGHGHGHEHAHDGESGANPTTRTGSGSGVKSEIPFQTHTSTLDDDIVGIPNILVTGIATATPMTRKSESEHPKATCSTSAIRIIPLQFNICEVLYVTAWTLRLYAHHRSNAVDDVDHVHSMDMTASFLHRQSRVLSHDARYESMEEVLMACVEQTKHEYILQTGVGEGMRMRMGFDWKTLVNDVACICRHRRMTLKVLFDAMKILQDGCRLMKKQKNQSSDGSSTNTNTIKTLRRKDLKLAIKKIEYYTAWSTSYWDDISINSDSSNLSCNVERWLNDWTTSTGVEDDNNDVGNSILMISDHSNLDSHHAYGSNDVAQSQINSVGAGTGDRLVACISRPNDDTSTIRFNFAGTSQKHAEPFDQLKDEHKSKSSTFLVPISTRKL